MPDSKTPNQRLILAAVAYGKAKDNGPLVSPFDTLSGFWSMHPGGANFCFADHSVRFIKENIDPAAYRALSTRASEKTKPDDYSLPQK
jgi:prepilin-type processing-associated H-X9-DG protein